LFFSAFKLRDGLAFSIQKTKTQKLKKKTKKQKQTKTQKQKIHVVSKRSCSGLALSKKIPKKL